MNSRGYHITDGITNVIRRTVCAGYKGEGGEEETAGMLEPDGWAGWRNATLAARVRHKRPNLERDSRRRERLAGDILLALARAYAHCVS